MMKILENKIFFHEVIRQLSLESKPIDKVIKEMMAIGIDLYFDHIILGAEADDYERIIHSDGEEGVPYVGASPPEFIEQGAKKILECFYDGKESVAIYRFESNDIKYCCTDNEGGDLSAEYISLGDLYVKKDDLDGFINKQEKETLPAYLDKKNNLYAPDLDLAIQLHKAIYEDKYGSQNLSREQRVDSWLNSNTSVELSRALKNRLATIIRINKK